MSALSNITSQPVRNALADRCFTSGALAIDGTNTENVQTTVAVVHCVNGVFQTDFAAAAEINLSALTVLSAKDGSTISGGTKTWPARASGDADQTLVYLLACKGNVAYIIEQSLDVAAAQDDADYELMAPPGYAVFGAIKIVRADTDTATFQLGNDTSAQGDLDQTGRTTTFFNLSAAPPTVALLTTV